MPTNRAVRRRTGPIGWWVTFIVFQFTLGATLLITLLPRFDAWRFESARRRWQERRPDHYQLTLEHHYVANNFLLETIDCRQTLEVEEGEVVQVVANNCPRLLTIEAIFSRFEPYVQQTLVRRRCGYGGCVCAVSSFAADYDDNLGMPRQISRSWNDATPGGGALWVRLMVVLPDQLRPVARKVADLGNRCTTATPWPPRADATSEEIRVVNIEPLP